MGFEPDPSLKKDAANGMDALFEQRVRQIAKNFHYPTTPDLAVRQRQLRAGVRIVMTPQRRMRVGFMVAAVLVILIAALMASPARARVLDWMRIGAVRIFFSVPTPTAQLPAATDMPSSQATIAPIPLQSILDIAGETSLAQAREQVGFPIRLPAFPADLGEPDRVYLQLVSVPVVVLVWMDSDQPDQVRMALSQTFSAQPIFEKYDPKSLQETQVKGHRAVWVDGDYFLVTRNGDAVMTRLIDQGHTLIWDSGEITYRLETDEDLETAISIAESIP